MLPGLPVPTLLIVELTGLYSALQTTFHSISSKNLPYSGMLLRESKKKETNTAAVQFSVCVDEESRIYSCDTESI